MREPLEKRLEAWHNQQEAIIKNPHSSREDFEQALAEGATLLNEINRDRQSARNSYQTAVQFL